MSEQSVWEQIAEIIAPTVLAIARERHPELFEGPPVQAGDDQAAG